MTNARTERLGERRVGWHRVELVVSRSGLRLIDRHPARAAAHEPRVDELELPGWAVALERRPNDKEIAEILDDGVRQVFP